MQIGKKIKAIREKLGLSQENLYPKNQSIVSQIESGKIKSPKDTTLRIIAENLEMSFEELIKDTDWDNNSRSSTIRIALSTDYQIEIDERGVIKTKLKVYPLYNEKGEKNQYDPYTGKQLITECSNCSRSIESADQLFCMGCGENIRNDIYDVSDKIKLTLKPSELMTVRGISNVLEDLIKLKQEIGEEIDWLQISPTNVEPWPEEPLFIETDPEYRIAWRITQIKYIKTIEEWLRKRSNVVNEDNQPAQKISSHEKK